MDIRSLRGRLARFVSFPRKREDSRAFSVLIWEMRNSIVMYGEVVFTIQAMPLGRMKRAVTGSTGVLMI